MMTSLAVTGFRIVVDPKGVLSRFSKPEVWEAYARRVVQAITEECKATIQGTAENKFRNPTGAAANAWNTHYDVTSNIGRITNSKPYVYYLNVGVRRQQMTWLLNTPMRAYSMWRSGRLLGVYWARAPIPLKNAAGGTIFRRATAKSMVEGKWIHPGIPAMNFVEEGVEDFKLNRLPELFGDMTVSFIREEKAVL